MTLAKAIRIAALKHGQSTDKGGQPFIGHPLRVMARMAAGWPHAPEFVLEAAVCHDVLEDTGTDAMELVAEGVSPKAVQLVEILSHNDDEGYFEYIERVRGGVRWMESSRDKSDLDRNGETAWAAIIKLEDLGDNLNPQRRVPGMKLPERYGKAVTMLRS